MNNSFKRQYTAVICEIAKLKRSKVLYGTIALFVFIPLMMGLMVFVVQHPEISSKLGIIAVKASILGGADWHSFMNLVLQLITTLGFIGFGFVSFWVFGSEYMEHTIKDILAMPVSRIQIIHAKFIISFAWCLFLSVVLIAMSLLVGTFMNLKGWSIAIILDYSGRFFIATILTITLTTPVAFLANYGKGIIAPLGFVLLTMIMSQFAAYMGLGPLFPWAIPGLSILPAGTEGMELTTISYIILFATSVLFYYATVEYLKKADQHG